MATLLRTLNGYAYEYVEPIFHAKKSAWVCSPWISISYAEKLYDLSRKGVEVRIITSDDVYNSQTYSYLSQRLPKGSMISNTNLDVHFLKADLVHSKIYIVDKKYAVSGAVNFTIRGLTKQTNNFLIAENEEVESIVNDFMKLWIGYTSESVKPSQTVIKNILPIKFPFEESIRTRIKNESMLDTVSAKLIINPYYAIQYSLLENVRLPWYQQTVVEDKDWIVIDASNGEILNKLPSSDWISQNIVKDLSEYAPLKEFILSSAENYEIVNREWDIKIDNYKAEALAINYIKERNRREIPYNDRREGEKYQSYLPSNRAITILSKELCFVPIWEFQYAYKDKKFKNIKSAFSGETLESDFNIDGAICEECSKSVSENDATHCPICNKWLCPSELIVCSSCQRAFHKVHLNKTCPICHEILCNDCAITCPICKREYGRNHSLSCRDCGLILCPKCIITSGLILKKVRCPSCNAKSKKK